MQAVEEAVNIQVVSTRHLQWQLEAKSQVAETKLMDARTLLEQEKTMSTQQQNHAQWLQNEWDATKQRVEELSKSSGQLETELAIEQQKTDSLVAQLTQANEQNAQLQIQSEQINNHSQWLQSEWDSTKQRVEELSKSTGQLETELAAEQQKAESFLVQLSQANEQNAHLQAHAQWLQNEWDAAKVKIDELNHSSHHWWTVADVLNQENKTLYISRSWRITKPLRLLSLGVSKLFNALLYIPKGIWWVIKWLIHTLLLIPKAIWWLFKSPFKLMLSGFIRYAIKRSALKQWFFARLRKYPKAYAHTFQFAKVRGIYIDVIPPIPPMSSIQSPQSTESRELPMAVLAENTPELINMSPRARRIYFDLKEAIDRNNKENS
jgi:O-antigen chain-terminating methyltransferase